METPNPNPLLTEMSLSSRVDGITQNLLELRAFLLTSTARQPASGADKTGAEIYAAEIPEGLEAESDELKSICDAGPILAEALANPATAHQALDTCMLFDTISRIDPDIASGIPALEAIDDMPLSVVDAIVEGSDVPLSNKMLRLICSRAVAGGDNPVANFQKYLPRLIAMEAADDPQSTQLYNDFVDALAAQATLGTEENVTEKQKLLATFLETLGYDCKPMVEAWLDGTPDDEQQLFLRHTIRVMVALEQIESGLCRKITDVFKIRNFGRNNPDMLADMYHERLNHPEAPYVLSLLATHENNFSSAVAGVAKLEYYYALKQQGVRFEQHECANIEAIAEVAHQAQKLYAEHGAEITDLIIEGHSDRLGAALSTYEDYQELGVDNAWYLWGFRKAMRKDARAFLCCCLAGDSRKGKDPCLAESVARVLGREIVAPSTPAACLIKLVQEKDRPRIDVKYISAKSFWDNAIMLPLLDTNWLLHPSLQGLDSARAILPLVIPAVVGATRNVGTKHRFTPPKSED